MSGFIPGVSSASSVKVARVLAQSDGTIVESENVDSVTQDAQGQYTIDYTSAGFSTPPTLIASPASSENNAVGVRTGSAAPGLTTNSIDVVDGFGSQVNCGFSFVAIGT